METESRFAISSCWFGCCCWSFGCICIWWTKIDKRRNKSNDDDIKIKSKRMVQDRWPTTSSLWTFRKQWINHRKYRTGSKFYSFYPSYTYKVFCVFVWRRAYSSWSKSILSGIIWSWRIRISQISIYKYDCI